MKTKKTKSSRSLQRMVRPLVWKQHHVKSNGYYGVTVSGQDILYVYQPADMRIKRGPYPWDIHCWFGRKEKPLNGRGRFGKFHSARAAKLAAQKWWCGQVCALMRPNDKLSDGSANNR